MNWEAVSAIGSCVTFIGILVIIFKAGAVFQRIDDLEERVKNIDKFGCRNAMRVHKEEEQ